MLLLSALHKWVTPTAVNGKGFSPLTPPTFLKKVGQKTFLWIEEIFYCCGGEGEFGLHFSKVAAVRAVSKGGAFGRRPQSAKSPFGRIRRIF